MPKKQKESVSSEPEESYDSEEMSDSSQGDELPQNLNMREADRSNLLNYESDDSDDDEDGLDESDDDILGKKALQK